MSAYEDALRRRPEPRASLRRTRDDPFSRYGRTVRAARERALFGEPDPSNIVSNVYQEGVGSLPLLEDIPAAAGLIPPVVQLLGESVLPGTQPQEARLGTAMARGTADLQPRDVARMAALNPLTTVALGAGGIAGAAALARRTAPVLRLAAERAAREPVVGVAGLPPGGRRPRRGLPQSTMEGAAPQAATRRIGAASAEGEAAVAGLGREAESFDEVFGRLWRQPDTSPEEAAKAAERISGQKRPAGFEPDRAVSQARFRALSEAGQGDIFAGALEARPAARAGAPEAPVITRPAAPVPPATASVPPGKPAQPARKFEPTEVTTGELSFHAPFQNRADVTARGEFVDEEGIQQFLRDAGGKFDPDRRGRITTWRDELGEIGERGRTYVLDGHHRVTLAANDWEQQGGRYVSRGPVDRPMEAVRFRGNYQEALAFSRDANRGGRPNTYAETAGRALELLEGGTDERAAADRLRVSTTRVKELRDFAHLDPEMRTTFGASEKTIPLGRALGAAVRKYPEYYTPEVQRQYWRQVNAGGFGSVGDFESTLNAQATILEGLKQAKLFDNLGAGISLERIGTALRQVYRGISGYERAVQQAKSSAKKLGLAAPKVAGFERAIASLRKSASPEKLRDEIVAGLKAGRPVEEVTRKIRLRLERDIVANVPSKLSRAPKAPKTPKVAAAAVKPAPPPKPAAPAPPPESAFARVYAEAERQRGGFLSDVMDLAKTTGGRYPAELEPFAIKSMQSAKEKVMRKGRPPEEVSDILRFTIEHPDPSGGLPKIVAALEAKGYQVVETVNRYATVSEGYRDVALKLRKGDQDPVLKELLIIDPDMLRAKMTLGHDVYDIAKDVARARARVGDVPELGEVERRLERLSAKLYSSASSLKRPSVSSAASSSGEISTPSLAASVSSSRSDLRKAPRAPTSASLRSTVPISPPASSIPPRRRPPKRPAPPAGGPPDPEEAIRRVRAALRAAPALQREQKAIYSKVRAQTAAKMASVRQRVPGEAGVRARFGVMKTGPMEKVQFESLRGKIDQADVDALVDRINTHPRLVGEFDRQNAAVGLLKLFGQHGGAVPTESELALLREVYGSGFVKDVLDKRDLLEKAWEAGVEVLNLPRSLMATGDLSAPFRQGVLFVGAPKEFTRALGTMARAAISEKRYADALDRIKVRPTYRDMKDGGLSLTEAGGRLAQREERFLSNLAERIPVVGRLVRASNRGYVAFLNQLRADIFDDYLAAAVRAGVDRGEAAVRIADFVNAATGRGSLGKLERAAPILNGLLFSPRLMAGRIQTPFAYMRLPAGARKRALQTLLADGALAASIMSLAKAGGAEVGTDPRSADFLKIKIPTPRGPVAMIAGVPMFFGVGTQTYGDETRFDILAGQQQYFRLAAQLATSEIVSSTTGRVIRLGEGYKPTTRKDVIARFIAQKENPIVSFVDEWLLGRDFRGQPFELGPAVRDRLIPMVMQDFAELVMEGGLEPPALGFGLRGAPGAEADTAAAGDPFEEALRRRAAGGSQ